MNKGELHVYPDATAVAAALADLVVEIGQTAFADRGRFSIALAGGNTPRAAYRLLAETPRRDQLTWSDVHVYFGDERCVPPNDEQSNFRMASETLLDSVPIPPENVHRMQGEAEPALAAATYAQALVDNLGAPPRFDLILLGLGDDAHTASLFPGSDPRTGSGELVRAVYGEGVAMWRITFTPDVINAARTVIFATEGFGKSAALAAVREGAYDPVAHPAQIVDPSDGRVVWLIDAAAAAALKTKA